jgi:hypothetical protein
MVGRQALTKMTDRSPLNDAPLSPAPRDESATLRQPKAEQIQNLTHWSVLAGRESLGLDNDQIDSTGRKTALASVLKTDVPSVTLPLLCIAG